ncbi:MAG: phosphotransferase [Acidimicrobiales bacterium]|nr:phosphotransferase [Acidimicrobiales bacterium]
MADPDLYLAAAELARAAFDIDDHDLDLIVVGENVTYCAHRPDSAYVLRLHRPGYHSLEELDSERVWLAALADTGISVPEPVSAPDGRFFISVAVAPGDDRLAGLTRWREGDVVADLQHSTDVHASMTVPFAQLGALMAQMHSQAVAWDPPAGFIRQRLDADGLVGEAPFWGRFWEADELTPTQATALDEARLVALDRLRQWGEPVNRFSVIHADLHLGNLLVDPTGALSVIDFDDAGYGWHQYDMAVALLHMQDAPDASEARAAFFEAYRATRPITDDELGWVPFFETVRLMALIGWKAQRPEVSWPAGRFNDLVEQALARVEDLDNPAG